MNPRPPDCEPGALPAELRPRMVISKNLIQYTAVVIVLQDRQRIFIIIYHKNFFYSRKKDTLWRNGKTVDLWNVGVISPVYQRISLVHCYDKIN